MSDGLLVSWVGDEGLAETWNNMCDRTSQLRNGDKVCVCNGITDPELMLEGFLKGSAAFRLQVQRGPFDPEMPETPMPPTFSFELEAVLHRDILVQPHREQDSEHRAQAMHLEAEAREDARGRDAKQLLQADGGELQRMMAERLAKSLRG
jgi:hypothetical protein